MSQGWELVAQVGVTELRHALGSQQITQWVDAEISQPSIGGEPVDYQIACGAGQDGLAAVRQSAQPGGAVDSRPDVVAIFIHLGVAGVHADAQPDRPQGCSL